MQNTPSVQERGSRRKQVKVEGSPPRSKSMTQEDWGRSPTMREKLTRWPRVDSLEKDHLSQIWSRMEREQAAILDTRDALLKEAGKGTTALSRMKQRVKDITAGLRETLCEICREECRG